MPRNQREWIKALEDDGWVRERGGKHQVKMVKSGKRPIAAAAQRPDLQQGPRCGDTEAGGSMIDLEASQCSS
jgi:predicted RNA binding protein YcfA (HicA-like mRNA interferase family)